MNYTMACEILGLDPACHHFSPGLLRKKYLAAALVSHPDKNPGDESAAAKFQQIHDAYEYLLHSSSSPPKLATQSTSFFSLVESFLTAISQNRYGASLLSNVARGCVTGVLDILSKDVADASTLLAFYDLLKANQSLLHLDDLLLEEVGRYIDRRMQREKEASDENRFEPTPTETSPTSPRSERSVVNLHTRLSDVMNGNIFRLRLGPEKVYSVPLWHQELEYDDLVVRCILDIQPSDLETNMSNFHVDEDNHIHVDIEIDAAEIIDQTEYAFSLGEHFFRMPIEKLQPWVSRHTVVIPGQGLPNVFPVANGITDESESSASNNLCFFAMRSDIVLHVTIY